MLIVFEGIDGTGKSTQIEELAGFLKQLGHRVVTTREPTDGPYGQKIRSLYNQRHRVSREEELQLFIDDRKEHVNELIQPALDAGKIVLCDRYFLSSAAYQGAAGLDPDAIIEANRFAPDPDLALIFELDTETSLRRITETRGEVPNDFEQLDSLKKVDSVFRRMQQPYIRRIDGSGPVGEVSKTVREHVMKLLQQRMADPQ